MKTIKVLFLASSLCFSLYSFAAIHVDVEGDKYSLSEIEGVDFDSEVVYFTKYNGWYSSATYSGPIVISRESFETHFAELKAKPGITLILYKGTNKRGESDLIMWIPEGGWSKNPLVGTIEYLSEQEQKPVINDCYH